MNCTPENVMWKRLGKKQSWRSSVFASKLSEFGHNSHLAFPAAFESPRERGGVALESGCSAQPERLVNQEDPLVFTTNYKREGIAVNLEKRFRCLCGCAT